MISPRPPFADRTDSDETGPEAAARVVPGQVLSVAPQESLYCGHDLLHISRCTTASSPLGPVLFLLHGFSKWFRPLFRVCYNGPATPRAQRNYLGKRSD
jgi:hypothetical protein